MGVLVNGLKNLACNCVECTQSLSYRASRDVFNGRGPGSNIFRSCDCDECVVPKVSTDRNVCHCALCKKGVVENHDVVRKVSFGACECLDCVPVWSISVVRDHCQTYNALSVYRTMS